MAFYFLARGRVLMQYLKRQTGKGGNTIAGPPAGGGHSIQVTI